MMKYSLTTLCASLLVSHSVAANYLTADISNDAFKAEISSDKLVQNARITATGIATDDDANLFAVSAVVAGPVQEIENVTAGLGGKLYFNDVNDENMQAFALGGYAEYQVPNAKNVSLLAEFFYAPGITASDDIDYQTDLNLRVSYQLLPNGAFFAGYRRIQVNIENGRNVSLDKGLHLGFEFQF
ncbi:YfaZ family outer membrane protein [Catenovulum sp. SX2]|uniref:YfaZ family outer membrane protein n=1 Tax=Catenovulum sp. SX2 TaxID=3398614 RepID=UPI003F83970E